MEKWKTISNFINYEVSNKGKVRNKKTQCFLKYNATRDGYQRVRLYKNGIPTTLMVHRIVVNAYIENPLSKSQVNHKDGNKTNNTVENLEWVTKSENEKHAYKHGLKKGYAPSSEKSRLSKKVAMINKDGNIVRTFYCIKDVERELGIPHSNIINVCKGKKKTAHGFRWVYI